MRNKPEKTMIIVTLSLLLLITFSAAGFASEKKTAIIPFKTTDKDVSDHYENSLTKCLEETGKYKFISSEKVDAVIKQEGIKTDKIFGLKAKQYKLLAEKLDADIIIHGGLSVLKTLKFNGWRKDISVSTRMYDGKTGKKIDTFKSDTSFKFGKSDTVMDAEKMADSASAATCKRINKM